MCVIKAFRTWPKLIYKSSSFKLGRVESPGPDRHHMAALVVIIVVVIPVGVKHVLVLDGFFALAGSLHAPSLIEVRLEIGVNPFLLVVVAAELLGLLLLWLVLAEPLAPKLLQVLFLETQTHF